MKLENNQIVKIEICFNVHRIYTKAQKGDRFSWTPLGSGQPHYLNPLLHILLNFSMSNFVQVSNRFFFFFFSSFVLKKNFSLFALFGDGIYTDLELQIKYL